MQNEEIQKINETSSMISYRSKCNQNLYNILKILKKEKKYYTILVNGKQVDNNKLIKINDTVLILPKISLR